MGECERSNMKTRSRAGEDVRKEPNKIIHDE